MNEYYTIDPETFELEKARVTSGEEVVVENGFDDTDSNTLYRYYKSGWEDCVANTDQIFYFN